MANVENNDNIPWVEKYRPTQFDDIVLDPVNRDIFQNILDQNYFPNLMFYGPPGTGKTTTIINLINSYNKIYSLNSKGTVIHLNASDERGIDIIRNQIYQFVKSSNFFEPGLKFVILDEVDYMTKNAQHALKYLLQTSSYNVRYCLICNYISKIDESLKNEFLCIRFNQLPKNDIYQFIHNISKAENLHLEESTLRMIQELYNSDIRSMINFMQLNHTTINLVPNLLTESVLLDLHTMVLSPDIPLIDIGAHMHTMCLQYNVDITTIINKYVNYLIRCRSHVHTPAFFNIISIVMHIDTSAYESTIAYLTSELRNYFTVRRLEN
jgi:DNA polymerase III delta prime subunit